MILLYQGLAGQDTLCDLNSLLEISDTNVKILFKSENIKLLELRNYPFGMITTSANSVLPLTIRAYGIFNHPEFVTGGTILILQKTG